MILEQFELLNPSPIIIDKVGTIIKPKLIDIKNKPYDVICRYLSIDLQLYTGISEIKEKYDSFIEESEKTLYNLIIQNKEIREAYKDVFSFFIAEDVSFEEEYGVYAIWSIKFNEELKQNEKIPTGVINNNNFDEIRDILLQITYMKSADEKSPPYKNERARKIAEKLAKAEAEKKKRLKNNELTLGKMISKYCASNKSGINMLNVWDMTIYQFYDQWIQNGNMRQCDIQDMIYTNSVNFPDTKSYDDKLWLK